MKAVFLNDFKDIEDLKRDFEINEEQATVLCEATHLFASYGCKNYSGDAFVLFKAKEQWFEVNGSHCSCAGLENQWKPELTSIDSIKLRLNSEKSCFGENEWEGNEFKKELISFIEGEE